MQPDYEEAVLVYSTIQTRPDKEMMAINYENSCHTKTADIELPQDAASFFHKYKVLITGAFLSFQYREAIHKYFRRYHYSAAFRLMEYKLSLLHDLMHTKVAVLQSTFGYVRRFICFFSILVASILLFIAEKQGIPSLMSTLLMPAHRNHFPCYHVSLGSCKYNTPSTK